MMTNVMAARMPEIPVIDLVVGQVWENKDGNRITIKSLEMSPNLDVTGKNTKIIFTDWYGKDFSGTFLEAELFKSFNLVEGSPTRETVGGLQDHHLLDLYNTIAVGQRWLHHKGDTYVITAIGLDANVGSSDFNSALVTYRPLQSGKSPNWTLTVSEFLKITETGKKRFTPIQLTGKDKREVQNDKSLRFYWRLYA